MAIKWRGVTLYSKYVDVLRWNDYRKMSLQDMEEIEDLEDLLDEELGTGFYCCEVLDDERFDYPDLPQGAPKGEVRTFMFRHF